MNTCLESQFFFLGGFTRLLHQAEKTRRHAFATGTYSNLRTQFRSYFGFCVYFQRSPLPANLDTICAYVQFLSRSLLPQSITNYMSGVKLLHILLGHEYNFADDIHLRLLLRGVKRLHPHIPKRAKPVVPALLVSIAGVMNVHCSLHIATFACSLLLFHTLARLGSVLPTSQRSKLKTILLRKCVHLTSQGMLVSMRHTKTIQFGERCLNIPLVARDAITCPVKAYIAHLGSLGAGRKVGTVPAFLFQDHKGQILWLTKSLFIRTFRSLALTAGDSDPAAYSGGTAYKRYLEFNMQNKLELHSLFSLRLP